jgi:hypothetical protein
MGILPSSFVFTQTNLQSFINCPYQFYLRYILRFPWPAAQTLDMLQVEADQQAGTRFHQLVHQYFLGVPEPQLSQMAKNDPDSRVSVWFEAFIATHSENLTGELFPEHTLGVLLAGHELTAKYDLLQCDGESFTIYDWKTSRRQPAKAWLAAQMQSQVFPLVLALHLKDLGEIFKNIRMVYWEAAYPQEPYILASSPASLAKHEETILDLMEQICSLEAADFQKSANLQPWRFCRYRSYCNRDVAPAELDAFLDAQYLLISADLEETIFEEEIS